MAATRPDNRNRWREEETITLADCLSKHKLQKDAYKDASLKLGRSECGIGNYHFRNREKIDLLVESMKAERVPVEEEEQSSTLRLVKSVTDKHPMTSTRLLIDRESEKVVMKRTTTNKNGDPDISQVDELYI